MDSDRSEVILAGTAAGLAADTGYRSLLPSVSGKSSLTSRWSWAVEGELRYQERRGQEWYVVKHGSHGMWMRLGPGG